VHALFWYPAPALRELLANFDWPLLKLQLANALPFGVSGIVYATQFDLHNYFVRYYFDQPSSQCMPWVVSVTLLTLLLKA
jgi:hypothetical protein